MFKDTILTSGPIIAVDSTLGLVITVKGMEMTMWGLMTGRKIESKAVFTDLYILTVHEAMSLAEAWLNEVYADLDNNAGVINE